MKKVLALAAVVVFLAGGTAFAAIWGKDASAKSETPVAKSEPVVVTKKIITQKSVASAAGTFEAADKAKAGLMGKEWTITLMSMGGKGRNETDVITFADDKVSSKNMQSLGYAPTNFTVRIQEDGTVTWETMQSSEKDGMAFWRGDIQEDVMRGVLSKRDKRNNASDFSFTSVVR